LTTGIELRERLWSVERRYLAIGTEADYAEHSKSLPLVIASAKEDEIRARIDAILRELYRLYTVTACRESMRNRASKFVTWIMLLFLASVCIPQIVHDIGGVFSDLRIMTILAVMSAGAVEGFISAQRRVQGVANRGESMLDLIELSTLTGTLLAPVTGAVFAAVLFMMFTGTLISGGLFPTIATPKGAVPNGMILDMFAQGTGPATGSRLGEANGLVFYCWLFCRAFCPGCVGPSCHTKRTKSELTRPVAVH
jgi:hypothetical protein